MQDNQKTRDFAGSVRELFEDRLGELRSEDFVAVASELGFHAYAKTSPGEQPKPAAENYLADIIGTNLEHVLQAYEWHTHLPMTEDGFIVSGFWDRGQEQVLPPGYEMEVGGRFLRKMKGED